MQISEDLVRAAMEFEGFRATPYKDIAGCWTIGYGKKMNNPPAEGMTVTQADAEDDLRVELQHCADMVLKICRQPLSQGQLDALTDFAFNLGIGNLQNSTLLRRLNSGDFDGAADEFLRWDHAGGKEVPGLKARRSKEQSWFLS